MDSGYEDLERKRIGRLEAEVASLTVAYERRLRDLIAREAEVAELKLENGELRDIAYMDGNSEVVKWRDEVAELKAYKTALVESRPHHEKLLDDLVTAEAKVSALTDEVAELRAELAEGVALMELRANGPTRWTRTVRERGLLEEE